MVIQWYPGHMTKALRLIEQEMKVVDIVIYVLDSRAPFSCVNPKFAKAIGNKPIIYVFNKSDLANPQRLEEWVKYFSKDNFAIVMNSTQSGVGKKLESTIRLALAPKIEKYRERNMTPTMRAMVIGVPNCGKSTLINNLSGKSKTTTGDRPGVTKGKQWVKLSSGIELLDMPGVLWPAFDNHLVAKHLAYIGSIKEEVLDIPELAIELISELRMIDKTIIEKRFGLSDTSELSNLEILEELCKVRKFVVRGGDFDYDRASLTLVTEFKQGKLGKITIESVDDLDKLTKIDRKVRADV